MQIRMRYRFTGEVQGVGFRFRAYHAANALGLTGWIGNEYDGSVTMEVQGDAAGIAALLDRLQKGLYIAIDHVDGWKIPLAPAERAFQIRD